MRELTEKAIAEHVRFAEVPTVHSTMHLYLIDGAVNSVGSDGTAWSYRDVRWSKVIVGVAPAPENNARITDWVRDYWEALHPHSAGGAYLNFMMEED